MNPRTEVRRKLRRSAELFAEAQALVNEAAEVELNARTGRWVLPWVDQDLPPEFPSIIHGVGDMDRLRTDWSWQITLHRFREQLERRGDALHCELQVLRRQLVDA